jgi:hypothetical protein
MATIKFISGEKIERQLGLEEVLYLSKNKNKITQITLTVYIELKLF